MNARREIPGEAGDPFGFPRLVADYLAWMGTRGYAPTSITARRALLLAVTEWLAERGITAPAEVTRPVLESYRRALFTHRKPDGSPLSFRTQSQRLIALRGFFSWAVRERRLLVNPAADLDLPRVEHRLPRPALTLAEVEAVLAVPDTTTVTGLRDRAVLEMLWSTGIRRAELARLQVFDLDTERATVFIRQGKGRKDRVVPVGHRAVGWARRWLDVGRPQLAAEPDEGTLFLNDHGLAFRLDALTWMVHRAVKTSGVGKDGACHLFRHTCATGMLEGGADLRHIQALLGHADPATTAIYAQVSIHTLQAVHAATHPADRPRPDTGPADLPTDPETGPAPGDPGTACGPGSSSESKIN